MQKLFCINKLVKDYKLLFSLVLVALVWGTTFLGIRIAVETIPGWYVAGIRQTIASFILFTILIFDNNFRWIGWKNFGYQALLGILMLVVANGLVTVAEETITSSLAALINAIIPILVFVGSVVIGLERFTIQKLSGVFLCIAGILFIFWDGIKDLADATYRGSIALMFCAILGWTIGTLITKKRNAKENFSITLNLFYQFAVSGVVQMAIAYFWYDDIDAHSWTLKSFGAMLYLACFGSVIAFFAFHYALNRMSPTRVSIISYINTIIAVFLGWLILDEPISIKFILAAILIISGVFITNLRTPKNKNILKIKITNR